MPRVRPRLPEPQTTQKSRPGLLGLPEPLERDICYNTNNHSVLPLALGQCFSNFNLQENYKWGVGLGQDANSKSIDLGEA